MENTLFSSVIFLWNLPFPVDFPLPHLITGWYTVWYSCWLVVEPYPSEKYQPVQMMIPNIWKNRQGSKPPTRLDMNIPVNRIDKSQYNSPMKSPATLQTTKVRSLDPQVVSSSCLLVDFPSSTRFTNQLHRPPEPSGTLRNPPEPSGTAP